MIRKYLQIFICFFLIVPIGTLLHEFGHYFVAKFFFKRVYICYSSVFKFDFNGNGNQEYAEFLISLAGPISTILISIIFTIWIFKRPNHPFNLKSIVLLSFSLFISREVLISLFVILKLNERNTDEFQIFQYLKLNPEFSSYVLLLLSMLFCGFISIYSVPRKQFFPFIIFGILGSIIGFLVWGELGIGKLLFNMSDC